MTAATTTTLFTLILKDEAPAIGSGYRWVFVKLGRKWAYLLSPFTMRVCRLRRAVWDGLGAEEVVDVEVITRLRDVLRGQAQQAMKKPTLFQQQALGDEK